MASVIELLPQKIDISSDETDALLEIAFLVTAVDGRLTDDELHAFGELTKRLHGAADVDTYLARFAENLDWEAISKRVRAVAPTLRADLHELTYKIALGFAFIDRDPHHEEDKLHALLGDALRIPANRRESLSREVGLDGGKAR
jgi:hypothetical protein